MAALSRRELLKLAASAGTSAFGARTSSPALRLQTIGRDPFSLGVASGEPSADGVVLWTRLAPEPLQGGGLPPARVDVGWEISADDRFRTIVRSGTAVARPELGHAVHVEADGLQPARDYYYRFHVPAAASPVGRTRTAPAPGAAVERLRFAVCGCSHYEAGYFTAFRHLAAENFDFVFHTGDYIYEGRSGASKGPRVHQGHEIYTLVDYRNRYAQYRTDPDLAAAHASAPFVVSWDDHEVDNDYAADIAEDGTPPELFLLRRAAAYQAYFEHMPLRRASLPAGPSLRLYRQLQFGSLIDLSVLDTRQYRADQVCGGTWADACPEAADPARPFLGDEQERWLFANLERSRAAWTIIGQQVPLHPRDRRAVVPAARLAVDKWDGYSASRDRLLARLRDANTLNPVVLSGDVHQHYASDLKIDFADPRSPVVGVEFTNSSITSGGDGTEVSADWDKVRGQNPHIKYHSNRRGYVACTATPSVMRADFRTVETVTVAGAPLVTAGTMVVEAGKRGLTSA